jgi:hypothetical protein
MARDEKREGGEGDLELQEPGKIVFELFRLGSEKRQRICQSKNTLARAQFPVWNARYKSRRFFLF